MELARYGVQPSEVERDPRPSRLNGLLLAGRVMDARVRLENLEDDVNSNGMQGAVQEFTAQGAMKPQPPSRTKAVGYEGRLALLHARAYPENTQENQLGGTPPPTRAAEQRAKGKSFWQQLGIENAPRLRVEGEHVTVLENPNGGIRQGMENPAG